MTGPEALFMSLPLGNVLPVNNLVKTGLMYGYYWENVNLTRLFIKNNE